MSQKSWYQFKNATDSSVELEIMDEIGVWGVTAKQFRQDLKDQEGKRIQLHICSPGGDIIDGNEIYNTLRGHNGGVDVTLGALCASIATVIAMAGDKISMAKNGQFMIHNPFVFAGGDSEDLRRMADVMDKMKDGIIEAYQTHCSLSKEEITALMDAETWMTAEEAKAKGFIDEIIGEDEQADVANRFNLSRFKNSAKIFTPKSAANAPEQNAKAGGDTSTNKAPEGNQPKPTNQSTNHMEPTINPALTADEIQAKIKAEANKLHLQHVANCIDIDNIVTNIIKRDGKDFSEKATEFKNEGKSADSFARFIATSDEFKPVKAVASGIELNEPLDALKGSPGFAFVNSEAYRAAAASTARGHQFNGSIGVETSRFRNIAESSITTAGVDILPVVADQGLRPLTVESLFSTGTTAGTSVRYIQQTNFAAAATSVAETGNLPAADFTFTPVDAAVQAIGDYIPVPEQLIADFPAVASLINTQLPYMVDRAVEDQITNGDGTGNNLLGFLQAAGYQTIDIATVSNSTAPALDLALKTLTKIRWQYMTSTGAQGGWEPDGYIIHPTDWEFLSLMKDAVGGFYRTNPFTMVDGQERLWGKRVAVSPVVAQGTIVAGAFKTGGQVFNRQGMLVEMTNSDGTNFQKRIVTIRAARRLALAMYRPGNICAGTGVNPQG